MKKIFLQITVLATLLLVSAPAYACEYQFAYSEPPKLDGWITNYYTAVPINTEGYTPVFAMGETSCGKDMIYVKDELLIGIIAVSGVLAGVVTTLYMRRKRSKK